MKLVVDTNVVIAAILRAGSTRNLFLNYGLELSSPETLTAELEAHKQEFIEKSGLTAHAYSSAAQIILSNVSEAPMEKYSGHEEGARRLTVDQKDWPFMALALSLGTPLWSNDKRLKQQGEVQVYNTGEIIAMLQHKGRDRV